MNRFDFTPYRHNIVGFDRLFDLLENTRRGGSADHYPPFNIARVSDDAYRITLAVADYVRVAGANLAEGLLAIDLIREASEAMKPKKIAIGTQASLGLVEDDEVRSQAA